MRQEARVSPSHSLLLVTDEAGIIPASLGNDLVAATSSCVAVGTLSEHDGETTISLSDGGEPDPLGLALVFDGGLATASGRLCVCTVQGEVLLSLRFAQHAFRVRIWANDPAEPDHIEVIATAP